MPRLSLGTLGLIHVVLEQFAIVATSVHDIITGRVNKHWRVVAGDRVYALRRYNARRSPAAIADEHDILVHLARIGWPVAAPLATADGRTIVEAGGRRFALFPFLAGRPAPYGSPRYLATKGGLLARLHRDMASRSAARQREGFGCMWDLDVYVRDDHFATFDELLEVFGRDRPQAAAIVRAERERNRRELAGLDGRNLPWTPVHFDFHHDNLLFTKGRLTALLDFDLVHLDLRVSDIATSIALDCLEPPAYDAIDPSAARMFLNGYLADTPLSEVELRWIVPLLRTQILWLIAFRLTQWAAGSIDTAVRSIERSVQNR